MWWCTFAFPQLDFAFWHFLLLFLMLYVSISFVFSNRRKVKWGYVRVLLLKEYHGHVKNEKIYWHIISPRNRTMHMQSGGWDGTPPTPTSMTNDYWALHFNCSQISLRFNRINLNIIFKLWFFLRYRCITLLLLYRINIYLKIIKFITRNCF